MAPKPQPARFGFTVGLVLAMASTILTITADRDLAAPSASPIYPLNFCFCIKAVDQLFAADPGRPSVVLHSAPAIGRNHGLRTWPSTTYETD